MILLSPFLFTYWLSMTSLLVLGGEEGAAKSGEWELWGEEEQSQARGLPASQICVLSSSLSPEALHEDRKMLVNPALVEAVHRL